MSDTNPAVPSIILRCGECLTLNRVPRERLLGGPKCGKCKAPLEVPTEPAWVRSDSYDRSVAHWPETLLVVFVAPMCVHCKIVEPLLNDLARERAGMLKVLKADTETDPILAQRFKVELTPTFVVYKDGAEVLRKDGPPKDKAQLRTWIDNITGFTGS
jgi:thioredoxin 2